MTTRPEGSVIFWGDNIPEHIEIAREYIRENGLTADDVRLVAKYGSLYIVLKREIDF